MRFPSYALLLVGCCCCVLLASSAGAAGEAGNATGSAAGVAAAAACGTVAGGPCCPGSPAWTCGSTADGGDPLVCADYSAAGKTTCYPMPGSRAAPCGGAGQACCPSAYHRHTDKALPDACAPGSACEPLAGDVPCNAIEGGSLAPCGLCVPQTGCGAKVGDPCCRESRGGPSDWWLCGDEGKGGGGSAPPRPGALVCDMGGPGSKPTCVIAP